MNLTYEEQQLTAIYNEGTREKTIVALAEMYSHLESDEVELRQLTESTISKLRKITNSQYDSLDLTLEVA